MHLSTVAATAAAAYALTAGGGLGLVQPALAARPDMGRMLREIKSRAMAEVADVATVAGRTDAAGGAGADKLDSTELIGDLITLPDGKLTPVGKSLKSLLTRTGSDQPTSDEAYASRDAVPDKDSEECKADKCCIWKHVSDDMVQVFQGKSGRCTKAARAAVRLGFHDAAGWSKATGPLGGADGSLVLAPEEIKRADNRGLEEIVEQTKAWFDEYRPYGVGMADLIQMSANVATVTCPLGPRVRSFVGRRDSSAPAPPGLIPPVTGSAPMLIDLFRNKTIQPNGLVALVGAHTSSQQRFVDPARAGDPQDSTPGVWDVLFYGQTTGQAGRTPRRVFTFQSDAALSRDETTGPRFRRFGEGGGKDSEAQAQAQWNEEYAREYVRLSLLGVDNLNDLTECTKALPPASGTGGFNAPDGNLVDMWTRMPVVNAAIADAVERGDTLFAFAQALGQLVRGIMPGGGGGGGEGPGGQAAGGQPGRFRPFRNY